MVNFDEVVTLENTPPGAMSMQHWTSSSNAILWWRIPIGFPYGAEAGATLTIPIDPSWTFRTGLDYFNVDRFKQFGASSPELYSTDLPRASSITRTATEIVLHWDMPIPAGAAGGYLFTANPVGGAEAVTRGDTFTATATMTFAPGAC